MPPIAFLFKGDEARLSDFQVILDAIFEAILAMNPECTLHVRSGGILLNCFSQRTTAVSRGRVFKNKSISYTLNDDKELRATLAVAFAASAGSRHHNLEVQTLPAMLLRQPIDCVTGSEIPLSCGDAIHDDLTKRLPAYLGFFEIDCGDPLTLELAANLLIPHCHYQRGTLKWIVPSDQGPDLPADAEWASKLPFSSIEMTTDDPRRIRGSQLSAIGEKNSKLLNSRGRSHHAERVLSSLLDQTEVDKDSQDFEIEFGNAEFGRANVSKLPKYCLNDEHTNADGTPGKGRDKAYLFRRLLGITRDDWPFLGEQLVAGLEKALPTKTRKNKYGIQYEVTIPVVGRNGRTMLVTCPWIIRPGEPPFLVTALFPEEADTTERGSLAELIVHGPQCPEFWKQLYEMAHEQGTRAAENWTPTPMWVEGYTEAISEGACGVSWVRLPDGRSRFARWLKKNQVGYKGHRGGYFVLAQSPSQSLERARKYSEEFARVLRLNGIECEVDWRYD
jgi:uncharacterized protein DUF6883